MLQWSEKRAKYVVRGIIGLCVCLIIVAIILILGKNTKQADHGNQVSAVQMDNMGGALSPEESSYDSHFEVIMPQEKADDNREVGSLEMKSDQNNSDVTETDISHEEVEASTNQSYTNSSELDENLEDTIQGEDGEVIVREPINESGGEENSSADSGASSTGSTASNSSANNSGTNNSTEDSGDGGENLNPEESHISETSDSTSASESQNSQEAGGSLQTNGSSAPEYSNPWTGNSDVGDESDLMEKNETPIF